MEVSGQLHAPAALPLRKGPRYPLGRRLSGPQSRSGRYGVEKNPAPSHEYREIWLYREMWLQKTRHYIIFLFIWNREIYKHKLKKSCHARNESTLCRCDTNIRIRDWRTVWRISISRYFTKTWWNNGNSLRPFLMISNFRSKSGNREWKASAFLLYRINTRHVIEFHYCASEL
jgi:hypothetical protein